MLTRRRFCTSMASAAGLTLLVTRCLARDQVPLPPTDAPFAPDASLRIGTDDTVTLVLGASELGQGIHTALAQIVAEDLDCDWDRIRVETAPAHPAYANPLIGRQRTAWSASIRGWWGPLRRAGARARLMLVGAAAEQWGVEPGDCRTESGVVHHPASGRSLTYGSLAVEAGRRAVPSRITLKAAASFRHIGQPRPRLELAASTDGSACFGADVRLEGMLFAALIRPPVPSARPTFDAKEALAVPGVRRVVTCAAGVAVLGENTWAAWQGRKALRVSWSRGVSAPGADPLSALRAALAGERRAIVNRGSARARIGRGGRVLSAEYFVPYLAHAALEPMVCTASVTQDRCLVLVPTQDQTSALEAARTAWGLPADTVEVRTTLVGGGFGRKVDPAVVREAVLIARSAGAPVQLAWSREEDLQYDRYRPASLQRLTARCSEGGRIDALIHELAGDDAGPAAAPPYDIGAFLVESAPFTHPVSTGIWRAVADTGCAFARESFLDELAKAATVDPLTMRRAMLRDRRARGVLDLVTTTAGWADPLPAGRARGLALHGMVGSWAATVAEVDADSSGPVRVRRIVTAVDCGTVVNPDGARAQVEGAMAQGLSAALFEQITPSEGFAAERNFDRYRLLRLGEMPEARVVFVPSQAPPAGLGEVGLPPVAPAVANAFASLTGQRLRHLPLEPALSGGGERSARKSEPPCE
jgi:isoquinoline 1-oxidoreductase subunit beta